MKTKLKERIAKRKQSGVPGKQLVKPVPGSAAHVLSPAPFVERGSRSAVVDSNSLPFHTERHNRSYSERRCIVPCGVGFPADVFKVLSRKILAAREWSIDRPTVIRVKCNDGWTRFTCRSRETCIRRLKFLAERIGGIQWVQIFNEGDNPPPMPNVPDKRVKFIPRFYQDVQ